MTSLTLQSVPSPIRIDPDGAARVGQTRVLLDLVVVAYQQGKTPEAIVASYPALRLADVYGAIAYYLDHRDAIDAYLHEREIAAAALREANQAHNDPPGLRERLLARRTTMTATHHDAIPR